MSFTIKQLSYIHPNREVLFQNINFSINSGCKASLVGNNGVGKSTLFKILSGDLQPTEGEIILSDTPYYIPQHFGQYNSLTIAEALGISNKINSLHSILEGDASEENFSILNDDWEIEDRAITALNNWGLKNIDLSLPLNNLSGGEKTKVFLAGINIHSPSIILMDEPTNHLDKTSRKILHNFIKSNNSATLLIISHDRALLNLLSTTYELEQNSITCYGGNFDFYKEEKERAINALQNKLTEQEKELRKAKKTAREAIERQQKHGVRGEKQNEKKGVARIAMGNLKSASEKSSAKLKDIHTNKIEDIKGNLENIKNDLSIADNLKLNIESTNLHEGKILIESKGINFKYTNDYLWQESLYFVIRSGERVVVYGDNGSGKTTLIKLLLNQLEPQTGSIKRNSFSSIYIDQDYSIIDNNLTVYEQVEEYNSRQLLEHELKIILNRFLFPKGTWDKKNSALSGGEKMRLLLCCLQVNNNAPDVIVLDEPTNNLDIQSLNTLIASIKNYKGTLILISHDETFVEECTSNTTFQNIYVNRS
ncbi:ATPase subunit of ABC transporter with duplicated ATPase domains [Dysgonomonadaceae bacterium PH5-43]|nr:ATPase subunit of ABC transporter with duplicated ATPase domains [Dysgonomonadaceae bacterium PH5-43]